MQTQSDFDVDLGVRAEDDDTMMDDEMEDEDEAVGLVEESDEWGN
ncbi:MAG: hypothetical protein AAB439_00495 [Patescibacteria group bacterium]